MLKNIGLVMKCSVIAIPMEYEIMSGQIAVEELAAIHNMIHAIIKAAGQEKLDETKN
jgi:hypothetical protein